MATKPNPGRQAIAALAALALVVAPTAGCAPSSIEQRTKTISVHSEPEGAAVYRNGEKIGETPLEEEETYKIKRYENDTQHATVSGVTAAIGFLAGFGIFLAGANQTAQYNDKCEYTIEPASNCDQMARGGGAKAAGTITMLGSLSLLIPMFHFINRPKVEREKRSVDLRLSMRGHRDTAETLDFPNERVLTAQLRPSNTGPAGTAEASGPSTADASATAPAPSSDAGMPADSFVSVKPQPTAYALVIGIENYRDLPSPNGAAADARQVAELFETSFGVPGDQIRVLTDDEATRADIQASLDWIRDNVSVNGRIYVYFGGHGAPKPEEKASYLLPYEASTDNLSYTGLPLDGLVSSLRQSPAGDVVAFVDACFSGQGSRSVKREGTRPVVPTNMLEPDGKTAVYTAAETDQISGPTERGDRGLFTHHLLRALGTGRADLDGDGQISAAEVDEYVSPRVERDAREMSREQTPTLVTGDSVDDPSNLILNWGLPTDG